MKPLPPRPNLLRRPQASFGWLEVRLLHDGWLRKLGPEGSAVMLLLALAADSRGASFWGRDRMATALGMSRDQLDRALRVMQNAVLLDQRPWRAESNDGVWQLLPVPHQERNAPEPRRGNILSIADVLASPSARF